MHFSTYGLCSLQRWFLRDLHIYLYIPGNKKQLIERLLNWQKENAET